MRWLAVVWFVACPLSALAAPLPESDALAPGRVGQLVEVRLVGERLGQEVGPAEVISKTVAEPLNRGITRHAELRVR